MRAWTRLIFAGAAALALAAPGCTPGDGDDEADADVLVVPDAVADTAADTLSDVPAGSRVYAGNMNFREGSLTCNVAFAITWDGEKFEDVQAYTAANPNAEHCDVEATTGVKVPIDQVTLRFGRYDDVDKVLKGGLELEFQSGGQTITSKLAWEGPLPSPATGFAGSVLEPFKNFTDISWHVGAQ
ncbi:MAG: hypothetical protein R3F39_18510 [Myxococcota bacterium]